MKATCQLELAPISDTEYNPCAMDENSPEHCEADRQDCVGCPWELTEEISLSN